MKAYKITRPDGTDFRTGRVRYDLGAEVVQADCSPHENGPCGVGLHVSPTARLAIRYADRGIRPWRYFEVEVAEADIIARDHSKLRVRRLQVQRELTLDDVLGPDLAQRVERTHEAIRGWKSLPWLQPVGMVTVETLRPLLARWSAGLAPYLRSGTKLPTEVRIVTTAEEARRAADAAADADAAAAAAAAAADAAAAAAAAADDADDAAAADDADDAGDDADAADAAAAAAAAAAADDADAAAADAADAAAADDAVGGGGGGGNYWLRWYVRPRSVLWRHARWILGGLPADTSPFLPLIEMYRLGVMPIGYANGAFTVWTPKPKEAK